MEIYYDGETKKALKNFPFSASKTRIEFIFSIIKIKKAAALANSRAGNFNVKIGRAISKACDVLLSGKYLDQFPLPYFQGGAGTAVNMNVNEVLASLATKILKNKIKVHPNNHVNQSGSTNDINPSALKISTLFSLLQLEESLNALTRSFEKKAKEFKNIKKLGRTHLQDAVPITLGEEFSAYAFSIRAHQAKLKSVSASNPLLASLFVRMPKELKAKEEAIKLLRVETLIWKSVA
jgi:aspartate ammonia-lyase